MNDAERNEDVNEQPRQEVSPDSGPHSGFVRRRYLSVTTTIIAICVVMAGAGRLQPQVSVELMFYPPIALYQPYRFITSAFLHNGFWHLVLNMYALWLLGHALEPVMGKARFLALYLISALAGNVAVYALASMTGGWNIGAVGASGAIFGLFGALIVLSRRVQARMSGIIILLAANLIYGFVIPGISWESHVGGLAAGVVLMWLWISSADHFQGRPSPTTRRLIADVGVGLGLCALLCALVLL